MMKEINDGKWNHERKILGIEFENQVGNPIIINDSTTGDITATINVMNMTDLSNLKIKSMELSFHAQASVTVGNSLNFENQTKTNVISVTSEQGEVREYTIHINEFNEALIGTWNITKLTVFGGTGAEYGGSGVIEMPLKSWCWSSEFGPSVEYDNTLTFTLDGVNDAGNPYGKLVNNAGPDGKYADFIYVGNNPENPGVTVDLKKFYRQIPTGTCTWIRDYAAGTVTFTDANQKVTSGLLREAQTIDLGYSKTMVVSDHAFDFTLTGTDDWTNIYSDYDKFAKKTRRYFISVSKQ